MKKPLTDYLSEDALYRLTEEAFQSPAAGEKPKKALPRLLALAASLAVVVCLMNFDTVYATVRELLYFIPGGGPVSQENSGDYWLPDREYSAQVGDTSYFVTYLYRRGDTLSIQVEKEYKQDFIQFLTEEEKLQMAAGENSVTEHFEEEYGPYSHPESGAPPPESRPYDPDKDGPAAPERVIADLQIAFLDEAGNPLDLEHTGHNSFRAYGEGEAEASEVLELSGFNLERFTLVLDETVRFPVELRRVDPEDYALTKSAVAEDAGYRLSLLPLNDRCTRFALIPTPVGERAEQAPKESYWSALSFEIQAVGEDGVTYKAESTTSRPGCQEYYIPGIPETRITSITVTGILESTRYDRSPAAVKLPALEPGEIVEPGQEIDLGNVTLTVRAAGLSPEGQLWVRVAWDPSGGRSLNQLDLDWPKQDDHLTMSHSVEEGAQVISADNMTWRAGKKTTLPITFVSVIQEGRWEFRVPSGE